jgi:hypothetical protein
MTDRTIIILGFALLGVLTLAAIVVSHLRRDRLATLGGTVAYLTRARPVKIIAVLIWAWLGWHFLAR